MSKRAEQLANIILSGPLRKDELSNRLASHIVKKRQCSKLTTSLLTTFGEGNRPSISLVKQWLTCYQPFAENKIKFDFNPLLSPPAQMSPARSFPSSLNIPEILTTGDLASWLRTTPSQLEWLRSESWPHQANTAYAHYILRLIDKRSGAKRLIECPKIELKTIQRHILDHLLNNIPSHSCSHGFQLGKSILSYVTPHVNKQTILKFDLSDYFLTVDASRTRSLFHRAGYPPSISRQLAALCTTTTPDSPLLKKLPSSWLYQRPHLPQGAPSSPAISDKLLFKTDMRLQAFAKSLKLTYTRYADDMAFSSDVKMTTSQTNWLSKCITEIIESEGWYINPSKTKVMKSSQQQKLAGIVINQTLNLARKEYDILKAILHNCCQNGIEANNKDNNPFFIDHLKGRVHFLSYLNPNKGKKLLKLLEDIAA